MTPKETLVKSPFEIKYSSLLNTTDVQERPSFGSHFLEESSPDQAKLLHTDTGCTSSNYTTKNGSRKSLVQRKDWSEEAGGRISRMGDFYDRSKNSQRLSTDENGLEISVLTYTTVPRDETSGAGCFGNSICVMLEGVRRFSCHLHGTQLSQSRFPSIQRHRKLMCDSGMYWVLKRPTSERSSDHCQ